ncbi:MAG: ATP-dependent Clp protease adaptor ClpS [Phycisphaerales bacterium]
MNALPLSPLSNAQQDAPLPPPAPAGPTTADASQGTATATKPAPARTPPVSKPLDQYKVLLHNSDEPTFQYVIRTLMEIVTMPTERAVQLTMEAHTEGVALVIVTHMELAELYRDRFQSKGLCSTIEKA